MPMNNQDVTDVRDLVIDPLTTTIIAHGDAVQFKSYRGRGNIGRARLHDQASVAGWLIAPNYRDPITNLTIPAANNQRDTTPADDILAMYLVACSDELIGTPGLTGGMGADERLDIIEAALALTVAQRQAARLNLAGLAGIQNGAELTAFRGGQNAARGRVDALVGVSTDTAAYLIDHHVHTGCAATLAHAALEAAQAAGFARAEQEAAQEKFDRHNFVATHPNDLEARRVAIVAAQAASTALRAAPNVVRPATPVEAAYEALLENLRLATVAQQAAIAAAQVRYNADLANFNLQGTDPLRLAAVQAAEATIPGLRVPAPGAFVPGEEPLYTTLLRDERVRVEGRIAAEAARAAAAAAAKAAPTAAPGQPAQTTQQAVNKVRGRYK